MGTDKVETVFCDFSFIPSDPSKINFQVFTSHLEIHKLINKTQLNKCLRYFFHRFPDVDWASGRQIVTRLLLRYDGF